MAEKQPVSVKTGEFYQPVRIYYEVFKPKTVIAALKKLKCMEREGERWNWLFEAEAKKLRFNRPYSSLSPADKPLILGYFTFRSESEMLLDLRSQQRALQALDFFEKRINRYAATPTRMRVVNRIFAVDEMPNRAIHPSLDPFFDRDDVPCLALETEHQLAEIAAQYADDPEAKEAATHDFFDEQFNRTHPEIEEILIHADKLDRLSLPMVLQMRQVEAFEHWRGNFTFRASDLVQQWVAAIGDEDEDEEFEADEEMEIAAEGTELAAPDLPQS
ncbi:MAG: hypothetical protein KME07_25305 [Pegethrix bostrychoides GSE-TBD4-15B]|jgi:hypothetical protein|uniref:Uncharacterized protein n=1 Tax=Pegethrix bostrychoides GSE-TBD4-15B TaxID=2839662 RepID=A0A951PGB8_9CYAN|nr:hypothetical protein [Pegethrix bostrychoides GSE-TBD4-15B]